MQYLFVRSWEGFARSFPDRRFARMKGAELDRAIAGYARAWLADNPDAARATGHAGADLPPGAEGDAIARCVCPQVGVRVSAPVYLVAMPSHTDAARVTHGLEKLSADRGWSKLGLRFGVIDDKKLTARDRNAIRAEISGSSRRPLVTSAFASAVEPLEAHAHAMVWGVPIPAFERARLLAA